LARETRILVVDDEPTILRALQTSLESQGYTVSGVTTGEQAVGRAASEMPDLVLLDLGLPKIDGFEVIRRIRAFAPALPIVVVSAHGDDASKVRALDWGADDYVSKPFSVPELLARVRTALRHGDRSAPLEATVIERGAIRIDLLRREASVGDRLLTLTPTQFDLLVCFARHPNRVLTHRMIATEVWGEPDAAESTNIRVFVSQLRRRLDLGVKPSQIATEPGVGYRFVPRSD
jgi:two-component system, OmpR family, KDP operon response regulator KdpE